MQDEFWKILRSQPRVGVLIVDVNGFVLSCNEQAKRIYYGNDFDPIGKTIEEIEGPEFAAERMAVIREVLETGEPVILRHIRGGKNTEALIWPMEQVENQTRRIIAITQQNAKLTEPDTDYRFIESQLVDLGPLNVLTSREIEVLALTGHGLSAPDIAEQLGVVERTVRRHRMTIAEKLNIRSIAEAARIVHVAGLEAYDAKRDRIHRWKQGDEE